MRHYRWLKLRWIHIQFLLDKSFLIENLWVLNECLKWNKIRFLCEDIKCYFKSGFEITFVIPGVHFYAFERSLSIAVVVNVVPGKAVRMVFVESSENKWKSSFWLFWVILIYFNNFFFLFVLLLITLTLSTHIHFVHFLLLITLLSIFWRKPLRLLFLFLRKPLPVIFLRKLLPLLINLHSEIHVLKPLLYIIIISSVSLHQLQFLFLHSIFLSVLLIEVFFFC